MLVDCRPKGQAGAKKVTTDENKDPKHPPTFAPMSSSAQNINNYTWKESVAFGMEIFKGKVCCFCMLKDLIFSMYSLSLDIFLRK